MSSNYFDPLSSNWGLRGDPGLWMDMKLKFKDASIPPDSIELDIILYAMFKDLVGNPPQRGKDYYVVKYDKGGMSTGKVCSDWWLDNGFLLIVGRFNQLRIAFKLLPCSGNTQRRLKMLSAAFCCE